MADARALRACLARARKASPATVTAEQSALLESQPLLERLVAALPLTARAQDQRLAKLRAGEEQVGCGCSNLHSMSLGSRHFDTTSHPNLQMTSALLPLTAALYRTPHGCLPVCASGDPVNHAAAYIETCLEACGFFSGLSMGVPDDNPTVVGQQSPAAAALRAALSPEQQAALAAVLPRAAEDPGQLWGDGRLWLLLAVMTAAVVEDAEETEPDVSLNLWASALHQLQDAQRAAGYARQLRQLASGPSAAAAASSGSGSAGAVPEPLLSSGQLEALCHRQVARLGLLLSKSDTLATLDILPTELEEAMFGALDPRLGAGTGGPTLARGKRLAASPGSAAAAAAASAQALLLLEPDSSDSHLAATSAATPAPAGEAASEAACEHARRALQLARLQRNDLGLMLASHLLVVHASQGVCPLAEATAAFEESASARRRCEEQLPPAWAAVMAKSREAAEKVVRRLQAVQGSTVSHGGSGSGRARAVPVRALWGCTSASANSKPLAPGQPTAAELAADPQRFLDAMLEEATPACDVCGLEEHLHHLKLFYCARCRDARYCS